MRLAVLSDIHGNLPALEAVLDDIQAQGEPDAYLILGDLVAFCPWPAETLARLRELPVALFLQGNTDRYVVTGARPTPPPVDSRKDWKAMPDKLAERDANFRWTVARLSYDDFELLRDLNVSLDDFDIVIYDVLGDVVCGGFATPMKDGYAQQVLVVASGSILSLLAANNIMKAVKRFHRNGARLAGRILEAHPFGPGYADLRADAARVGRRLEEQLSLRGIRDVDAIESLRPVFFRNKGAYIIGRIRSVHVR